MNNQPTSAAVHAHLREQWVEPFRRQLRTGCAIMFVGNAVFAGVNFFSPASPAAVVWTAYLLLAVILTATIIYLREPRTWRQLMSIAVSIVIYACMVTGVVGGLSGEYLSSLVFISAVVAFGPAIAPWSIGHQTLLALSGFSAVLINGQMIAGSPFGPLGSRPVLGIAFAFIGTIFVAYVMEMSRRNGARYDLERRLAEDEVRTLNEDLERRVKSRTEELNLALRELKTFTYTASHDLKAPLRAINAFSKILGENLGGSLSGENKMCLERISQASERMDAVIDALLGLSRVAQSKLDVQPVNLTAVARSISEELDAAEPERNVEWVIAPDLRGIGDPALIHIVLANLQGNAWKFTRGDKDTRIEIGVELSESGLAYFVRDNGPGFAMEFVDRIFEPFGRLPDQTAVEGTGIGLTTVHRIIERHGGRIWASSKPGEGSTFFFTLTGPERDDWNDDDGEIAGDRLALSA